MKQNPLHNDGNHKQNKKTTLKKWRKFMQTKQIKRN